jgi:hypothetical protein
VDFLDTADGRSLISSATVAASGGTLTLALPDFLTDIAFRARFTGEGAGPVGRALLRYVPSGGAAPQTSSAEPSLHGLSLNDSGLAGDEIAGDGIWSLLLAFASAGQASVSVGTIDWTIPVTEGLALRTDIAWESTGERSAEPLYLRGDLWGWTGRLMDYEGSGAWSLGLDLSAHAPATLQFKFCLNDRDPWSLNWGDANADGIGEAWAGNIALVLDGSGAAVFSFDRDSLAYAAAED